MRRWFQLTREADTGSTGVWVALLPTPLVAFGRARRGWLGVLGFAVLTATSACAERAVESPLAHAYTAPETLAAAALDAIAAQDDDALRALMISREEYETLVYPALPDSRSVTFDFIWGITEPRSRKARREALEDFRGIPLEVVSVDLGAEIEAYADFVLYKEAILTVRRTDTGEEGRMRLMDVLIEMGDGWKFMNFKEG